ncbi:MAG TPA: diguanylate cyclase, partial [Allocoleopsis sp.]
IETLYKLGYRLKQWKESDEPDHPTHQIIEPVSLSRSVDFPSPPAATLIPPQLWGVWQECRQSYCDRLSIIQNTATALQQGTLTPAQQQEAEQEVHTLIGSLGSFGLGQASQIARQIQQILKQPIRPGQPAAEQLLILIPRLRHHLENARAEQPTQVEATQRLEKLEKLKQPDQPDQPDQLELTQPESTQLEPTQLEPTQLEPTQLEPTQLEPIQPFSPLTPASPLPTLLIVDDDLSLAQILQKEALSWGWQAKIATRLHDAQYILQHHTVNIILLDLNFSDSAGSGLHFLAAVHRQSPEIPVVMLTAEETFEKRVEAARLGSRCFLQKPIAPAQVLATITQVLYQTSQSVAHLLIVDDDPALLAMLCALLEPCGYEVTGLSDPQQFWQTLEQCAPDLIILDVELGEHLAMQATPSPLAPALSGIELCQVIRSDPRWNRVPVLFLSAHTDIETVQRGFAVGADDFLSKPVVAQELLTRVQTRLEQRKLWQITDLDELTGVSLRRKAIPDLTRLIRLAQRQQRPFSLAVLDLDHFKQVNDRYGHAAGDHVLSYLGKLLHQSFRQEDIVGRWGGEEFIIGMYGITKQDGIKRLEEVLKQLNQYVFLSQNGMSFQVTFSAGIAQLIEDGDDLQTLYHHADQALYQAKSAGRNQILATPSFTPPP